MLRAFKSTLLALVALGALSAQAESAPEFLFHWSDPQGLEKMAARGERLKRLPMKAILGDQWLAKHWPEFTDKPGLFAWPSLLTAVQTSGKEFYARMGPNSQAPRLLAMRTSPTARVLVVDTVIGAAPQTLAVSLGDYDLLLHRARTAGGSKRYSEWIILNAKAVSAFSADPDKLPKKFKNELKDWYKTLRRHPERTGLPQLNIDTHSQSLKAYLDSSSKEIPAVLPPRSLIIAPIKATLSRMAILRALVSGTFLFAALLFANALQVLSLLIFPFSRHAFRRANRWIAHCWWGLSVLWAENLHGIEPVFTGDPVPEGENALVIANHQSMPDIVALMSFAWRKKRLGDMKWFVKDIIKYFPGVGWGMLFLDCVFLKRNWDRDAANIERTFAKLVQHKIPVWLMSFPEGTRLTPAKLALARAHAEKAKLPLPEHVLIPRTRGFVAAALGMRAHVDAVYDVTIGYPSAAPSMVTFLGWTKTQLHLHVRRYPVSSLPESSEGLARWVLERFNEKDELLKNFARTRHF